MNRFAMVKPKGQEFIPEKEKTSIYFWDECREGLESGSKTGKLGHRWRSYVSTFLFICKIYNINFYAGSSHEKVNVGLLKKEG